MPMPDRVARTGGYRLGPLLKLGAEVICDTRLIIRELDRRFPDARVRAPAHAIDDAIEAWAESDLFWPVVQCSRMVVSVMNQNVLAAEGVARTYRTTGGGAMRLRLRPPGYV